MSSKLPLNHTNSLYCKFILPSSSLELQKSFLPMKYMNACLQKEIMNGSTKIKNLRLCPIKPIIMLMRDLGKAKVQKSLCVSLMESWQS